MTKDEASKVTSVRLDEGTKARLLSREIMPRQALEALAWVEEEVFWQVCEDLLAHQEPGSPMSSGGREVRNRPAEEERIGSVSTESKDRMRLPRCLRKRTTRRPGKARHGNRSWVSARVEVGLVEKARARGNISQCVEEALKLYFAE